MEYCPHGDLFNMLTTHFPTEINGVVGKPQKKGGNGDNNGNKHDDKKKNKKKDKQNDEHNQKTLREIDLETSRLVNHDEKGGQGTQYLLLGDECGDSDGNSKSYPKRNKTDAKSNPKSPQKDQKIKNEGKNGCCCCFFFCRCCGKDGDNKADRPDGDGENKNNNNDLKTGPTTEYRRIYSERDVADWVFQICHGLAYLHSKNIVHADIKPENILVIPREKQESTKNTKNTKNNPEQHTQKTAEQTSAENLERKRRKRYHCKIIDFGLASVVARRHSVLSQDGSPEYMAPEVIKGQYTVHSDLWSLGILLFNLLYGFTPFLAYNVADTLALIEKEGFRPDSPTDGHCNSFPEFFIGKKKEKGNGEKKANGEENNKADIKKEIQPTPHDELSEPLLFHTKFDNSDDDTLGGNQYQPPSIVDLQRNHQQNKKDNPANIKKDGNPDASFTITPKMDSNLL